jgi:hypothetical protein
MRGPERDPTAGERARHIREHAGDVLVADPTNPRQGQPVAGEAVDRDLRQGPPAPGKPTDREDEVILEEDEAIHDEDQQDDPLAPA